MLFDQIQNMFFFSCKYVVDKFMYLWFEIPAITLNQKFSNIISLENEQKQN